MAPSNLHITDGKDVHEITIFLVKLKKEVSECSSIFHYIDSKLPRHTIFIIKQDNWYQLLVNYKQWKDATTGTTSLKRIEDYRIRELIIEDLKIYKCASLNNIHERIGKEIPEKNGHNFIIL